MPRTGFPSKLRSGLFAHSTRFAQPTVPLPEIAESEPQRRLITGEFAVVRS
ncbi:hypothetical protein ACFZB9_20435 [Kitasatospora sp. NPDC008050]|uniref:hypothetical protein n=1 Tax=Kitasatospora sp. NPDC008050 TaxID=3364021 RepID=UPI0036E1F362